MLFPGDEFYLSAFWELSTCRQFGWSTGPIPWRDLVHFAEYHGLDDEMVRPFMVIIRAMDSVYLKYQEKKNKSSKGKQTDNG